MIVRYPVSMASPSRLFPWSVSAVLLFVANYPNGTQLVGVSFLVGAICSGLAGVFGMRVRRYVAYPLGEGIIEGLGDEDVTDEDAMAKVTLMFIDLREKNLVVNNQRARLIAWGGYLLVVGFAFAMFGQIAAAS